MFMSNMKKQIKKRTNVFETINVRMNHSHRIIQTPKCGNPFRGTLHLLPHICAKQTNSALHEKSKKRKTGDEKKGKDDLGGPNILGKEQTRPSYIHKL